MKVLKRNAVILTVLLFVCVAVYLNWSYNRGENDAETLSDTNDTASVGDAAGGESSDTAKNDTDGDTNDAGLYYDGGENASVQTGDEYFAEARLTRQQARDEATQTLQTLTGTEGASQETVDEALNKIAKIADWTVKEAELESLIVAKGFEDCVVFISDDGINVTVPAPEDGLPAASVAKITDIVTTETDFAADNLKIIEIK